MVRRKPLIDYAIPGNEKYLKVPLLTTRGIRRTRVRASDFEKRFGLIRRKEPVYARKMSVYDRLTGTVRKRPVVNRADYIYNPEFKAYEVYAPDRRIHIKTEEGERSVTQEQLRYLYSRRGGVYERTKQTERVVYEEPRRTRGKIQRSFQIAITHTVEIDGVRHTLIGYSKVQRGDFTDDEMRTQAERHLKASVIDSGGKYDYSNVKFVGTAKEEYVKWVYGNGNY